MSTPGESDRVKLVAALLGLAAALLLAAWLLRYFESDSGLSDDPQVAELERAMQEPGEKDIMLLKQKYAALTPEQQQEFNVRKMLMGLPKHEEKLRDFFAQPEAEQLKQIDREIDAGEAKRRRNAGSASAKGNRVNEGKAVAGQESKGARGRRSDPRQIMSMKQEWTANASPELRSMMDRRMQMINDRRKQRGLQPL